MGCAVTKTAVAPNENFTRVMRDGERGSVNPSGGAETASWHSTTIKAALGEPAFSATPPDNVKLTMHQFSPHLTTCSTAPVPAGPVEFYSQLMVPVNIKGTMSLIPLQECTALPAPEWDKFERFLKKMITQPDSKQAECRGVETQFNSSHPAATIGSRKPSDMRPPTSTQPERLQSSSRTRVHQWLDGIAPAPVAITPGDHSNSQELTQALLIQNTSMIKWYLSEKEQEKRKDNKDNAKPRVDT